MAKQTLTPRFQFPFKTHIGSLNQLLGGV